MQNRIPQFVVLVLLCLLLTHPASAALQFTLGADEGLIPTSGNINDFHTQLTALSLTNITRGTLKATANGFVQFRYHGQESGWNNEFLANNVQQFAENSNFTAWSATGYGGIKQISVAANEVLNLAFDSNNGALHQIGVSEFGIFARYAMSTFQSVVANDGWIYFGHDDNGASNDDNHDDMIISARFIPEPFSVAVWGGMFGVVGLWRLFRQLRSRHC